MFFESINISYLYWYHKAFFCMLWILLFILPWYIFSIDPDNVSVINILTSIKLTEMMKLFINRCKLFYRMLFNLYAPMFSLNAKETIKWTKRICTSSKFKLSFKNDQNISLTIRFSEAPEIPFQKTENVRSNFLDLIKFIFIITHKR